MIDPESGIPAVPADDAAARARALLARLQVLAELMRGLPATVASPSLVWRDPQGVLQWREIRGDLVVGRPGEADVGLVPPAVARRHCRVWREGDEVWVEHLGSESGTIVNGLHVTRQALRNGDLLEVGGVLLAYLDGSGASTATAAR